MPNKKWDAHFMQMALMASMPSKDPSTKVGAVIVDPDRTVRSMGYNGFPRGVKDSEERYADRDLKYPRVVHAEANAIVLSRSDLRGCIIYCTLFPCCECAKLIIQAGITEVVCYTLEKSERFYDSMSVSMQMFDEAGVTYRGLKPE